MSTNENDNELPVLETRKDVTQWISDELGSQVEVTRIQHIKIGAVVLTPIFPEIQNADDEDEARGLYNMLANELGYSLFDRASETASLLATALANPIRQHPSVVSTSIDLDAISGSLAIVHAMSISAVFSEEPLVFELFAPLSAQREIYNPFDARLITETPEKLLVFFDGMIFMSVVDVQEPLKDSVHGQICREFFDLIYDDSDTLERFHTSPTPLRDEFHIVYIKTADLSSSFDSPTEILIAESGDIFIFVPDTIDRRKEPRIFFKFISRHLRAFYVARATQSFLYFCWSELSGSYSELPKLLQALHKARFPRYFTTMTLKRELRSKVFDLLFALTEIESALIGVKKIEQSALRDIKKLPMFESLEKELIDQSPYDTETVVRLLKFLDAELNALEGVNAEVTGALVGVVVGALLSLLITLVIG